MTVQAGTTHCKRGMSDENEGTPVEFPTESGDNGADRVVTAVLSAHSIRYVPSRSEQLLTKRRAVDFCRVATAMCPRPVPFVA